MCSCGINDVCTDCQCGCGHTVLNTYEKVITHWRDEAINAARGYSDGNEFTRAAARGGEQA